MCNNFHYIAQVIIAEEVGRHFARLLLNLKPMFRLKVILAIVTKVPLTWKFSEIDFSIFISTLSLTKKWIQQRRTLSAFPWSSRGIITNQAIVQTHGPHLRLILKSLLVVIFSAGSDQPNCNWHADQTSDTLRKTSAGEGQSKNSRCKTCQLL